MDVSLIFPHQLFQENPALKKGRKVILIEEDLFFTHYPYHKQKLVLHRASMKNYEKRLEKKGFPVSYIENERGKTLLITLNKLRKSGVSAIHYTDTVDYLLERRLKRFAGQCGINLIQHRSPNFICTEDFIHTFFSKKKRYFQTDFYIELRKQNHILIDKGNPEGGSWTYDVMNRKRLPAVITIPARQPLPENTFVSEAKKHVEKNFHNHYGSVENFNYPISFEQAEQTLNRFLSDYFCQYGDYQDAIDKEDSFLFHAVLTPALNIGLLQPEYILDKAIKAYTTKGIPLNSAEGFIRQIIGWREFIRSVYIREGVKERTSNYFNHQRKIPTSFYSGTTGIEPVDAVIKRVLKTGYANHIERLMILGNFMLLCGFHPDDIYQWFMELFIDAYDWVMVPNVYGMSQFADGGLMATKPYISGSNYILKMSHYKKGEWCNVWDGLYWKFIDTHKELFIKNPRMSMMVKLLEKMDQPKRKKLLQAADTFLESL
ncbi:MAG: cryptochrome/photolyase family protein [Cyclobacteriaceae bacterium]